MPYKKCTIIDAKDWDQFQSLQTLLKTDFAKSTKEVDDGWVAHNRMVVKRLNKKQKRILNEKGYEIEDSKYYVEPSKLRKAFAYAAVGGCGAVATAASIAAFAALGPVGLVTILPAGVIGRVAAEVAFDKINF